MLHTRNAATRPVLPRKKSTSETILAVIVIVVAIAAILAVTAGVYYGIYWLVADVAGFGFKWGIAAMVAAFILSGGISIRSKS